MHQHAQPSPGQSATDFHSQPPEHKSPDAQQCVVSPERMVSDESDISREVAILHAGREIEAAMARYAASSCFADRADADAARLRMEALIRGRSTAKVDQMERDRGLA